MKKAEYETIFGLINKIFIVLLTGLANGSNHRKCVLLSNQKLLNLLLSIYILMNTETNFIITYLRSN